MAVVQNMAKTFFNAFEEFQGIHPETPAPAEWEEFGTELREDQRLPHDEKSNMQKFTHAWEKFNLPNIASNDSLSSICSTNSSCSDFSEYSELIAAQDAGFLAKFFLAIEKFTFEKPGHSRLPFAPQSPQQLTHEEFSTMRKVLIAFEKLVNPPESTEDENDEQFPKFC